MSEYINTVTNVSIEWILKNVNHSVDGYTVCSECGSPPWYCAIDHCTGTSEVEWEAMIDYKIEDTDESTFDSIMEDGILKPICLRYDGDGNWAQGNGHHRLAIAILLCLDSIPAVFSFDKDEYMMSWVTM